MWINSYDYTYLESAMKNLGEAFDYAKNSYNLDMDKFMNMFITSGYSKMFEDGNPKILIGISGSELVLNVFEQCGYKVEIKLPQNNLDYSPEYWCGWIIAYYQWKTCLSFKYIHSQISMQDILLLYPTLHEASEDKFVNIINERIKNKKKQLDFNKLEKYVAYHKKNFLKNLVLI